MFTRFAFMCVLAVAISGCSSTSDRYAFWRNNNEPSSNTRAPNLGDVPEATDKNDTLAEIEEIRARLERDRDAAYEQIQQNMQQPSPQTPTQTINIWDVQNSATLNTDQTYPVISQQLPHITPQQQSWQSGHTVYHYSPQENDTYIYGQSAVHIQAQAGHINIPSYTSNDPSVSIDWSAFGDSDTSITINEFALVDAPSLVGAGQPVAYYAYGSARLNNQDRQALQRIADQAKNSSNPLLVVGYASQQTGVNNPLVSRKINLNMSVKRTLNVANELARMGVDPSRLRIAAMGDSFATSGDSSKDRRVDILFDR